MTLFHVVVKEGSNEPTPQDMPGFPRYNGFVYDPTRLGDASSPDGSFFMSFFTPGNEYRMAVVDLVLTPPAFLSRAESKVETRLFEAIHGEDNFAKFRIDPDQIDPLFEYLERYSLDGKVDG